VYKSRQYGLLFLSRFFRAFFMVLSAAAARRRNNVYRIVAVHSTCDIESHRPTDGNGSIPIWSTTRKITAYNARDDGQQTCPNHTGNYRKGLSPLFRTNGLRDAKLRETIEHRPTDLVYNNWCALCACTSQTFSCVVFRFLPVTIIIISPGWTIENNNCSVPGGERISWKSLAFLLHYPTPPPTTIKTTNIQLYGAFSGWRDHVEKCIPWTPCMNVRYLIG